MISDPNIAFLLQAQHIAIRQWRDIKSMYRDDEISIENAALIVAAQQVAHRLSKKALAALQSEEVVAQRQ